MDELTNRELEAMSALLRAKIFKELAKQRYGRLHPRNRWQKINVKIEAEIQRRKAAA